MGKNLTTGPKERGSDTKREVEQRQQREGREKAERAKRDDVVNGEIDTAERDRESRNRD